MKFIQNDNYLKDTWFLKVQDLLRVGQVKAEIILKNYMVFQCVCLCAFFPLFIKLYTFCTLYTFLLENFILSLTFILHMNLYESIF